jgi:hypothetical protein
MNMTDIEAPTRRNLLAKLEQDFFVYEGWEGRHKHGGEVVKYDLVLLPRQHLLDRGFDNGYVIVEVKLFNTEDKNKHDIKARDLLWQCVAYSFSEITLPSRQYQRPLFVLYFIAGTGFDAKHKEELNILHHFVQRGGVGRLGISAGNEWTMTFGGSFYFRSSQGKGPHHVGIKRQTGSSR